MSRIDHIKAGMSFIFSPSGKQYTIKEIGEDFVSWYNVFSIKEKWTQPVVKVVTVPKYMFVQGLEKGTYKMMIGKIQETDSNFDAVI